LILEREGGGLSLARLSLCSGCCRLGFRCSLQLLLADLLRGAVTKLGSVLSSGRRKIAILRAVQIRPGVKDSNVVRRVCRRQLINLVYAAGVHVIGSYKFWKTVGLSSIFFLAVACSFDSSSPVSHAIG
jgi:hypothetical protein